jgi:hypothetical protein
MGRLVCLGAMIATAVYAGGPIPSVPSHPVLSHPVPAHRLNRAEYRNTVRDLTGVDLKISFDLPPDDSGYGFDNIGDVLTLSPILMERYFAAADRIARHPEVQEKLLVCDGTQPPCARQILEPFARRAYRRPVTAAEVNRLLQFVEQAQRDGDTFENGILLAARAVLVSPHFLFKIEPDPTGEIELASRLSYFLWSGMPDEELVSLAEQGHLRAPGVLQTQVRRMLSDPKSAALVENFAGQWLEIRNLDRIRPDHKQFPAFDGELRNAMKRETLLFFDSIMREDRGIFAFLDANYTFLNERLAQHYGISGVTGPEFRRVTLEGIQRGGILTQASVLTVSSYPTRTSPVLRGKFLLANILNAPLPPPPAGVPQLAETSSGTQASIRQQMEEHRSNPACSVCHSRMDPLGFALENYDAIGHWRDADASAVLPDGRKFSGPAELRQILRSQPDAFRDALSSKMLTYALGRGLDPQDHPAIESIRQRLAANDDRFSELILGIVNSEPFQQLQQRVQQKVQQRPQP